MAVVGWLLACVAALYDSKFSGIGFFFGTTLKAVATVALDYPL